MNKKMSIIVLFFINSLITISGLIFIQYSFQTNLSFKVLNTDIPGFILGILILYFSIRNYISVYKLKKQICVDNINFSWKNFKKMGGKAKEGRFSGTKRV